MKTHNQPQQATRKRYFSSMFSQLLGLFSRTDFQRLVMEHKAGEKIAAKTLLTAKNDFRNGMLPPVTTLHWGPGMAAFAAAAGGEASTGKK